ASILLEGDRHITGFDVASGVVVFTATTATALPELFALVDGVETRLSFHTERFHTRVAAAIPERFVVTSADGMEVEAWLLRPPAPSGPNPGLSGSGSGSAGSAAEPAPRSLPVILDVHGGPFAQYGNRFFDEVQMAAGAGYAVIYSNPRGSSGYGEAFARGIRGPKAEVDPGTGWGGADYEDLMAVIDQAIEQFPELDPERMAVMGGSYGGYMTSWIIGHTDRFKTAISERALNNMLTFAHTSDIGSLFPAGYIGANHLDDPDEFIRQSPTTYWRDINTPVLILHAENDLRCPIEQAEDLFLRLKLSGKTVEFVRFPGESHELSRSGNPVHRVARMEIILDWLARTL
ncbi:MAG: alpha/beta hydrolase family protein, partial [Acidimicrobiales bacterium]